MARKNDRHGGFTAVRAVAVYIVGSGCFETNKPILVKWGWNTLTQRVLQVVRNTKKGLKLQVLQQKKKTKALGRKKGLVFSKSASRRKGSAEPKEKWPCVLLTLCYGRVVEAEVLWVYEMQAGRLVSIMGSTSLVMNREDEKGFSHVPVWLHSNTH